MSTQAPVAAQATGLSNVVDTVVSPGDAFDRLSMAPTWGWALVIAVILLLVGTYVESPAARHAAVQSITHMTATSPLMANLTAEKKAEIIANAGKPSIAQYIVPVVILFIIVLLNTVILLIGNAVGGGKADFKRLWCGSMNIAVPTMALGILVTGVVTMLRGPDAFNSNLDMLRAVPGLAMFAGDAPPVTVGFLSGFTVFTIWGAYLNATMMRRLAKTSAGTAWTFALLILFGGAILAAAMTAAAGAFKA